MKFENCQLVPLLLLLLLLLPPNRALPPLPPLTYNISGARQWQDPEWSELEDRERRKSGEQAAALVSWWQNQSGRYAWEQGCPGGSHPGPLKVSRGCELSSCQCVQCSPTGKSPSPSGPMSCTTAPSTTNHPSMAARSVSRSATFFTFLRNSTEIGGWGVRWRRTVTSVSSPLPIAWSSWSFRKLQLGSWTGWRVGTGFLQLRRLPRQRHLPPQPMSLQVKIISNHTGTSCTQRRRKDFSR